MVVEGALEGELDDHLGYGKNDPAGCNGANSRNGHRGKAVFTEARPVELSVHLPAHPRQVGQAQMPGRVRGEPLDSGLQRNPADRPGWRTAR